MLKAVLCDLDNTLILYDEACFFINYLHKVAEKFADIMTEDKFSERIWQGTVAMHNNDGRMINRQAFLDTFCQELALDEETIWNRFEEFYAGDYDCFRSMVVVPDRSREVLRSVRQNGLKLVIATNPVWPQNAQMKRISWAGLGDIDYDLVTHIDNTSFCKPKVGYYEEICRKIGERPEDCLMVGDDYVNDMVAARLGMKTYLTEDSLHHVESPLAVSKQMSGRDLENIPPADFKGPISGVMQAVEILLR